MKVITVLEATVAQERVGELERAYREGTGELPIEIAETFLVRDTKVPGTFRIITVWSSMEALQAMRASGVKPKGIQIFEQAGATPELSVLEVVVHQAH